MADYIPIQDGDALSASVLDSKFDALESNANNILSVSSRALDHYNGVPSMVEPEMTFSSGARFMGHAAHSNDPDPTDLLLGVQANVLAHRYSFGDTLGPMYPGFDSSTTSTTYYTGWRIIGDSLPDLVGEEDSVQGRSDAKLMCQFTGPHGGGKGWPLSGVVPGDVSGVNLNNVGGILVLLNAEVLYFHDDSGKPQPIGNYGTVSQEVAGIVTSCDFRAWFSIQVHLYTSDGTEIGWWTVKKATRALSMVSSSHTDDVQTNFVADPDIPNPGGRGFAVDTTLSGRGQMWKDVAIRTLITWQDFNRNSLAMEENKNYPDTSELISFDSVVAGVRAVVSLESIGAHKSPGMGVTLKAYSMSTLVLASDYKASD